jgi:hypothetical protein
MLDKIVLRGKLDNLDNECEFSNIMDELFKKSADHILDICIRKFATAKILDFEFKTFSKIGIIELTVFIELTQLPNASKVYSN